MSSKRARPRRPLAQTTQVRTHNTRAATAAAARCFSPLLELPDELLSSVATALLSAVDLPSLRRLRLACKATRTRLEAHWAEHAHPRRLRWEAEVSGLCDITDDGCTVRHRAGLEYGQRYNRTWAVGPVLPITGKTTFTIRVTTSHNNEAIGHCVGICTADRSCAWYLGLYSGRFTSGRITDGRYPTFAAMPGPEGLPGPAPGYPGVNRHAIFDRRAYGLKATLQGRAIGARIAVTWDADAGEVSFAINDEERLEPIRGFPRGAALRPLVRPNVSHYDALAFAPAWHT